MIKSNDDTKVLSLPNAEPQVPRLEIQSAANFLAGVQRLDEIRKTLGHSESQDAEEASIRKELSAFVNAHAVSLVHGWLQAAAVLAPLQQSLANIIGPAVAKALADRFDKVPEVAK